MGRDRGALGRSALRGHSGRQEASGGPRGSGSVSTVMMVVVVVVSDTRDEIAPPSSFESARMVGSGEKESEWSS